MSAAPRPIAPRLLRYLSLVLLAGTVASWALLGAHRGWTQNRIPIQQVDEITGIEYVTYVDRFVPGIDWLGGGMALALVLYSVSVLPHLNRNPKTTPTNP